MTASWLIKTKIKIHFRSIKDMKSLGLNHIRVWHFSQCKLRKVRVRFQRNSFNWVRSYDINVNDILVMIADKRTALVISVTSTKWFSPVEEKIHWDVKSKYFWRDRIYMYVKMRFCPTLPIEDSTSGWVSIYRLVGIDLLWKSFICNDIML